MRVAWLPRLACGLMAAIATTGLAASVQPWEEKIRMVFDIAIDGNQ